MLYLNSGILAQIGIEWTDLIEVVTEVIGILKADDYVQPIKPYLRYGDMRNRIIAMPAYIGGSQPFSGIKWIASFPGNIKKNKPRANSVTVLNEWDTGIPVAIFNTSMISAIRTAAVSATIIDAFLKKKEAGRLAIGIIGCGPIGKMHLQMVESLFGDRIEKVYLYDINRPDRESIRTGLGDRLHICGSWQECYRNSNIFITCTVADRPYIDLPPRKGALILNVSLRDFVAATRGYMDIIVVDNWEEVCRENTDIENMHRKEGLSREDTIPIQDFIENSGIGSLSDDAVVMFNPMGMAVFDVAVARYYYLKAISKNTGLALPD